MNKSESIKNLAVALGKAQSEIKAIPFDATNPFFKSKYTSLGAIIEVTKPILHKNGLTVSQPVTSDNGLVGITTFLVHDSGEYLESTVTMAIGAGANPAQEAGKAITYLRRYSLASLLNLYSDEDTDGNEPVKKAKSAPAPKMEMKTAEDVEGSDKKRYGDCTDEELAGKMIGITKALKDKDTKADRRETLLFKRDAILTIQQSRE
jgi:hypothetical protein